MKNLLKQYKVLIALAIIALGMSSCYVAYPRPHPYYAHPYYGHPYYHYYHHYGY